MKENTSVKFFYRDNGFGVPLAMNGNGALVMQIIDNIISGYGSVSVVNVSIANNIATVTTATAHNFKHRQVVLISNCNDAALNTEWKILDVPSATSFTFITDITGTMSGAMTVKVAPLTGLTVTNPSANIYYLTFDNSNFLKIECTTGSPSYIKLRIAESNADANISPNTFQQATAGNTYYCFASDGNCLYLIAQYTNFLWGKTKSLSLLDIDNRKHFLLSVNASGFLQRNYAQTAGAKAVTTTGFLNNSSGQMFYTAGATNPNVYPLIIPISIWEDNQAIRGTIPGIYDHGAMKTTVNYSLFLHAKRNYLACPADSSSLALLDTLGPWL